MIVLYINIRGGDILGCTNGECHVFTFSLQEEDILEHTNGKCHLCTLWSTCGSLCNIGMHLITLLNIHLTSVMSFPFLYPQILGKGCARFKSSFLLSHLPLIYRGFWHWNSPPKNSNHKLAIIMLSSFSLLQCWLCVIPLISHTTLNLYYHASMLTL